MDRKEIEKALKWCSELRLCVDCPMRAKGYFSHAGNACRKALMENALSLIKELTEENERYKDLLCKANAKIYELQRELERSAE